jgi:hypothetical protein
MAKKDIVDQFYDYTKKNPFNGERRDMPFTHVDYQTFGLPESNKWRGMTIGQIYDAISNDPNELADFAKTYQTLDSDPADELSDYLSEIGNLTPREYNERFGDALGRHYYQDESYDRRPFPSKEEKANYEKADRRQRISDIVDAHMRYRNALGKGDGYERDIASDINRDIVDSGLAEKGLGYDLYDDIVDIIRSRRGK